LKQFVLAPVNSPELLSSLLPLIMGAVVIELYFGKYEHEELGWNTSVGNAVLWVTTGINLLINQDLNPTEAYATYFLIGIGSFVGYMNFFHKWSETLAFVVSSSGIVYSLAYVTVLFVRTDLAINTTTLKAAGLFFIGVNVAFRILQDFETPRDTRQFGNFR